MQAHFLTIALLLNSHTSLGTYKVYLKQWPGYFCNTDEGIIHLDFFDGNNLMKGIIQTCKHPNMLNGLCTNLKDKSSLALSDDCGIERNFSLAIEGDRISVKNMQVVFIYLIDSRYVKGDVKKHYNAFTVKEVRIVDSIDGEKMFSCGDGRKYGCQYDPSTSNHDCCEIRYNNMRPIPHQFNLNAHVEHAQLFSGVLILNRKHRSVNERKSLLYLGLNYVDGKADRKFMIQGQKFKVTFIGCATKCRDEERCNAFNFHEERQICEILSMDLEATMKGSEMKKPDNRWSYFEAL